MLINQSLMIKSNLKKLYIDKNIKNCLNKKLIIKKKIKSNSNNMNQKKALTRR